MQTTRDGRRAVVWTPLALPAAALAGCALAAFALTAPVSGVPASDAAAVSPAASVAQAPAVAGLDKRLLGHSVEGRPIWAYRKGNPDATRTVVVVGQMHGDETAGVRTARYIKNHVPVARGSDVWVVPTMNPDGLAAGTRRNARDVDLNRNWPTNWVPADGAGTRALSEPETRAMFRFLKLIKPGFVVSLHQPFGGGVGLGQEHALRPPALPTSSVCRSSGSR